MALPQQIRDAEAAADAILAQANTPQDAPQPEASTPTESNVQADAPVSADAVTPEPTPAPAPDPFETKYKVLQGKYNAEVPELHRKVHALEDNLRQAIAKLEEVGKQKEQPQQTQADPKDVENFGSDLVDMVNRIAGAYLARAASQVEARLAEVDKRIAELAGSVSGATQHVAMTAEQMFFDRLGKLVPDWETINADQRFLAWLAEVDPVYGVPRQAALENARNKLDASRAAAVFNTFTGPRQQAPKADPLDKQVSPKGAAGAAPTPSQKKMVASTEITKFYDDVRRGVYRGREQQAAQLEAEFNLALQEGRVR